MAVTDAMRALLQAEMARHAPFTQMDASALRALLSAARQTYYAPGERILQPADGPVARLLWIRRGAVTGRMAGRAEPARVDKGAADAVPGRVASATARADAAASPRAGGFQLEAGEMFPIGALLAQRAVTSVYEAVDDVFCLEFDAEVVRGVVARDPVLADFMNRRLQHVLALSQAAERASLATHVLTQHAFDAPLSQLPRREPVAVSPQTPLREALALMHARGVGSVLAVDAKGAALGILTRHDLLPKLALSEPPLDLTATPLAAVMSAPVHTLDIGADVQEAALLMARHGIRHVPLTDQGRVVNLVSERDLFALQRRSIRQLGTALREAPTAAALRVLAAEVRAFARQLLAQGVTSRSLTALVSHLNDQLTARLVALLAAAHGLDLGQACWVAFGSEGRGEQTIATDQDNGLVLADACDDAQRERWRAMAKEVNQALDDCGYPLCKGGVMAGEAACCLTQRQWSDRFGHWMARSEPQDLLDASIYFDLRPVAGHAALVQALHALLQAQPAAHPRFLRALAENSLRLQPALNWHGGLDAQQVNGRRCIDIKLHGTAVFVDAARWLALVHRVPALGTRERLLLAGEAAGVGVREREAWVGAFDVLQMLRLRTQIERAHAVQSAPEGGALTALAHANLVDLDTLHDLDRRLLKEAMRVARRLQQRVELDGLRP